MLSRPAEEDYVVNVLLFWGYCVNDVGAHGRGLESDSSGGDVGEVVIQGRI
jgi:hypothetical protein